MFCISFVYQNIDHMYMYRSALVLNRIFYFLPRAFNCCHSLHLGLTSCWNFMSDFGDCKSNKFFSFFFTQSADYQNVLIQNTALTRKNTELQNKLALLEHVSNCSKHPSLHQSCLHSSVSRWYSPPGGEGGKKYSVTLSHEFASFSIDRASVEKVTNRICQIRHIVKLRPKNQED